MRNNIVSGFSLIEIILSIALLGIIAMIVVPNFSGRVPLYQRKEFISTLNAVVRRAWVKTIESAHPHKIVFNLNQRTLKIQERTQQQDAAGKFIFKDIHAQYIKSGFVWDERYKIENFYVEGVDEVGRHATGSQLEDIWFFIVPEGLAQEAIINILDTQDATDGNEGRQIGLVLNPFSVEFEVYDDYQRP
ncbi:type II secretion system GspH family protein [Candidatus Babeliales bacterium]|nr:type II secretion system GspH family protein [Candidatus Babeliales bacterium]